jgi:uncharacterized protein YggU (UPF0235/DUF167 family)
MSEQRKFDFKDPRGGSALGVRVITRAAETELAGKTEDGALKVRLKAAPAGAAEANKELVDFLASRLGVTSEKIEIVAGLDKSDKIVSIEGLTTADVEAKLITEA